MALVRFVSPKHPSLRIRFGEGKSKFTVKFHGGDAAVTSEQAAVMRQDDRCENLFSEVVQSKKSVAATPEAPATSGESPKAKKASKSKKGGAPKSYTGQPAGAGSPS